MSKTALITGASSGLGRELALLLAAQKYNLVLIARREDKLKELADQIEQDGHNTPLLIPCDLNSADAVKHIIDELRSLRITVDLLINNAGFGLYGRFEKNSPIQIEYLQNVNMNIPVQLVRALLPGMIARNRGQIINIASIGGFFPGPLMSVYFATKAFILSWTEALALELHKSNIRIAAFCPGPFKADFQKSTFGEKRNTDKEKKLPSARYMAEVLIRSLPAHKTIIIPPGWNTFIYWGSRILGNKIMGKLTMWDQSKIKPQKESIKWNESYV